MFILIEPSKISKEVKDLSKERSLTLVSLFKINLDNKKSISEQLEEIRKLKSTLKTKYTAIQLTLKKIENSSVGTINNLKREFDVVIGLGGLNKVNRFFLEQTKVDFLQDPHNSLFFRKTDFIHHFNSGINHVLCNLAKENDIAFLISLNFLENKKHMYKDFGRINQNLKFARKYEIPTYINFEINNLNQIKSKEQIMSTISLFDISNSQKIESVSYLEKRVLKNIEKKSKDFISDSIKIK